MRWFGKKLDFQSFLQLANHTYHRVVASSEKVRAGQNDILRSYYAKIKTNWLIYAIMLTIMLKLTGLKCLSTIRQKTERVATPCQISR